MTLEQSEFPKLSALLVEDEAYSRMVMARILGKFGLKAVAAAANGREAMRMIDAAPDAFDLIITDLQMPDVDGIELFRHLRDRNANTALILASGVDEKLLRMSRNLAKAQGLRVVGALKKPVSSKDLMIALQNVDRPLEPEIPSFVNDLSEAELQEAIRNEKIQVHYQPKVNPQTGSLMSVEALVRWDHPLHGLVGPDAFIPLAETSGLIDRLTDIVVDRSLKQAMLWRKNGIDVGVAINFSAPSLTELALPDKIMALARSYGLPPASITLEVTESSMMHDAVSGLDVLGRLRMNEIGLSIDDFGTGYSSLQKLRDLPFNELKIDRSFIIGAREDRDARAIVEASVQLGKIMEMRIVAEGVETKADWEFIRTLGCDEAQGWFIARSMPGDALLEWLRDWHKTL